MSPTHRTSGAGPANCPRVRSGSRAGSAPGSLCAPSAGRRRPRKPAARSTSPLAWRCPPRRGAPVPPAARAATPRAPPSPPLPVPRVYRRLLDPVADNGLAQVQLAANRGQRPIPLPHPGHDLGLERRCPRAPGAPARPRPLHLLPHLHTLLVNPRAHLRCLPAGGKPSYDREGKLRSASCSPHRGTVRSELKSRTHSGFSKRLNPLIEEPSVRNAGPLGSGRRGPVLIPSSRNRPFGTYDGADVVGTLSLS